MRHIIPIIGGDDVDKRPMCLSCDTVLSKGELPRVVTVLTATRDDPSLAGGIKAYAVASGAISILSAAG